MAVPRIPGRRSRPTTPPPSRSRWWPLHDGVDGWLDDDFAFVKPWGFDVTDIRVPVRVMQGEQDLMVPYAHGTWLVGQIPGVEPALSPDHGHLSLAEKYGEVHDWLLSHS